MKGLVLARKPEHKTLCFFSSRVIGHENTSCVQQLRLQPFHRPIGSPSMFRNDWLFMRAKFYVWLQIPLEWLHVCCYVLLPCAYRYMQVCHMMLHNTLG